MSSHHPKESSPGPHGAADDVNYGLVIKVGLGSLALFAVSIFWASKIYFGGLQTAEEETGKAREVDMSRQEIGIVDQVPFVSDRRLPEWKAARHAELTRYGWVDKSKGVVRIPIEAAMDKVAAGAMPAGAPK
jgi:hypothetical protein